VVLNNTHKKFKEYRTIDNDTFVNYNILWGEHGCHNILKLMAIIIG